MPTPTFSGVPPWATFEDLKAHINRLTAELQYLMVNMDSLNVTHLTAETIDTGTLDANKVTIRDDLNSGAYIQIDGNGMVINNGSYDTFSVDTSGHVDMTSATISSATGYPKVVLDPSGNLFGAYLDANDYIEIEPDYAGSPSLNFIQAGNLRGRINTLLGYPEIFGDPAIAITSSSTIDVTGQMRFDDFTDVYDVTGGQSLQNYIDDINNDIAAINAALGSKATAGASTGSGGGAFLNGGIAPGTVLMVSGGGTVTWGGISVPSHSHTQT